MEEKTMQLFRTRIGGIGLSGVEVQKENWNGVRCIRKTVRNKREANVLKLLNKQAFPAPILYLVEETGSDFEILMEEIQGQHLEVCPFSFEKAMRMIHEIQMLDLDLKNEEGDAPSIHSGTQYQRLEQGPSVEEVCASFGWNAERAEEIKRIFHQVMEAGPLGEQLVAAHGDYHPRNILIRNGKPVPIDWEKAGLHSIYQDIYALLDMCYPDADACLMPNIRRQWLNIYLEDTAHGLHLGWKDQYFSYVRLNRLVELVSIHKDMIQGIRSIASLLLQAEFVYTDLLRCTLYEEVGR